MLASVSKIQGGWLLLVRTSTGVRVLRQLHPTRGAAIAAGQRFKINNGRVVL